MKRIFKTRPFVRWMSKTELTDALICKAVDEIERGLIDAELGGGLIKKRIALPGRGKRGSIRTIIAINKNDRWVFLFGFEKSEMSNISLQDMNDLKLLAEKWLKLDSVFLNDAINTGQLKELIHDRTI